MGDDEIQFTDPAKRDPEEASEETSPTDSESRTGEPQEVIVTDVRMSFTSMVEFMVKWTVASIPALLILSLFGFLISALLGLAFGAGESLMPFSAY